MEPVIIYKINPAGVTQDPDDLNQHKKVFGHIAQPYRECVSTLCALGHGLGLHKALGEAALERILMSVHDVLALQQPLQILHLQAFVPCQEALGWREAALG